MSEALMTFIFVLVVLIFVFCYFIWMLVGQHKIEYNCKEGHSYTILSKSDWWSGPSGTQYVTLTIIPTISKRDADKFFISATQDDLNKLWNDGTVKDKFIYDSNLIAKAPTQ